MLTFARFSGRHRSNVDSNETLGNQKLVYLWIYTISMGLAGDAEHHNSTHIIS